MTVPEDCKTIYVETGVGNDICNGAYTLDEATQQWKNEVNATCVLQKVYDSNTGGFRWAFGVQVPEGSPPPPGSEPAVGMVLYPEYVRSAGVYFQRLLAGVPPVYIDRKLPGDGVSYFDDSDLNLPAALVFDGDKLQGLPTRVYTDVDQSEEGIRDLSAIQTQMYTLQQDPAGVAGIPNLRYLTPPGGTSNLVSAQYPFDDVMPDWFLDTGVNSQVGSPGVTLVSGGGNYFLSFEQGTTANAGIAGFNSADPGLCAGNSKIGWGSPTAIQGNFYPEPFVLSRMTPRGTPFVSMSHSSPASDFYNYVRDNIAADSPCAWTSWWLESDLAFSTAANEVCPADADWSGTGVSVSKNAPGGGGGDGAGAGAGDGAGAGAGDGDGAAVSVPGFPLNLQSYITRTYVGTSVASKYKGWVFDERTSAISGPFVHEDVTAIATKDNSAEMYCVTEDKEVKKTDLLDFNNPNFPTFVDPFTDISTPFDGSTVKGIVASKTAKGFCFRNRFLSAPFEDSVIGGGTVEEPLFFRDSYLANSETNWMHLGDEHSEKQVYRVDLRFHKNSCGHLWLYVKNDEGLVKGQYKGAIKEHMKVFTNLRGRSFKIHMLIATHHDYPWAMREMAVGHLFGKSF